jgi:hypothetical protein
VAEDVGAAGRGDWARECAVFTRYLTGAPPADTVTAHYLELRPTIPAGPTPDAVDRMLLSVARISPAAARMADAYSRIMRPASALRQALVLLLAILENSPPTDLWLNRSAKNRPGGVVVGLLGRLALFAVLLGAGIVVLGPPHLFQRALGRR